ncbi:MAG: hypothetical protein GY679_01260 [Mycoplasma sp.]|nr:hypothetical protein [Mycoplasma sp.]
MEEDCKGCGQTLSFTDKAGFCKSCEKRLREENYEKVLKKEAEKTGHGRWM